MRRTIILALSLIFTASALSAGTPVQDRRIREEKREALRPTESAIFRIETAPKPPPEADTEYFKELLSRRVTCLSDACRVLTILLGAGEEHKDLESQISFLKEKGIFPKKIREGFDPDMPLRKGTAACMFVKALDIKGGVFLRLFGINERYAMKELIYEGIMYPGAADDIIVGKELILMLDGSADYLADKHPSKAAKDKET